MDTFDYWFFFILGLGFYYLIDKTMITIRPRYLESVEESINDTAHLLSSFIEIDLIQNKAKPIYLNESWMLPNLGSIVKQRLNPMFQNVQSHKFNARIYSLTKTSVDTQVYVTDAKGIVVYDSHQFRTGLDYSKFNDVLLTLNDKYGARSSKIQSEEDSGALFVSSAIRVDNKIVGVLTVIKPKSSVNLFIEDARQKFWNLSILIAGLISLLFLILVFYTIRPIRKLSDYISKIRLGLSPTFPKIAIPEIRDLGREMEHLISELEGRKYIENYIQTFTHEIRSPLTSIIASSELLQDGIPETQIKNLSKNIQSESRRIQEIIDRLLELSSLENSKGLDLADTIDLNELCKDIIQTCMPEIQKFGIQISFSPIELPLIIKGNEFYLRFAFMNLLRNAIEFTDKDHHIQISISHNKINQAQIQIYNETDSIPEYAIDKIWNKFYSLPRKRTGRKSSGLGLALVKQVLNYHNASIQIENVNKGVMATVIFL
ncbi:MAG: two-component system sensor histidine kinase CreC [Leptospiraceae bacterium]|nr:two-component system sensor histidine kinase CreC [Leptospiraceae bacterium]MCZ8347690.1 two-component system sensor histidine kinase CreC [Leptospiraceae bacterium]